MVMEETTASTATTAIRIGMGTKPLFVKLSLSMAWICKERQPFVVDEVLANEAVKSKVLAALGDETELYVYKAVAAAEILQNSK